MRTVKGIFRSGKVYLEEALELEDCDVLVTFLTGQPAVVEDPESILLAASVKENLTWRQLEALEYLKQGYRNDEIADFMELTSGTVRNLLSSCYESLGVTSRTAAVEKAIALGMLQPYSPRETAALPSVYLTKSELRVLRLVKEGRTNKDIAEELELGVGTVRNYVSSVIRKLEVRNRTEAVREAVRRGLI